MLKVFFVQHFIYIQLSHLSICYMDMAEKAKTHEQ